MSKPKPSPRPHGRRLMAEGYASILASLRTPASHFTLAELHATAAGRMSQLMRLFVHLGLVHVCGYEPSPTGRWMTPLYLIGIGETPLLINQRSGLVSARQYGTRPPVIRSEVVAFASIVRALSSDSHHGLSLAEATGVSHALASKVLRHMRKLRLIYVADWLLHTQGGGRAPMYRMGMKADVRRPPPCPHKELWRRYNAGRADRYRASRMNHALAGNSEQFNQRA